MDVATQQSILLASDSEPNQIPESLGVQTLVALNRGGLPLGPARLVLRCGRHTLGCEAKHPRT